MSGGWMMLAAAIAAGGAALLVLAPVWQVWPAPWSWLGRGGAVVLGLALIAAALPRADRREGRPQRGLFSVAMVPWYLGALTLGLFSCTLAGIWLAVTVALTVWAVGISGALRVPALSRTTATAMVLLMVFGISGLASLHLAA